MASAEKGAAVLDQNSARRPNVFTSTDRRQAVQQLWERGLPPGDCTGWPSLDRYYTVVPGQLTVLTGWPGSGKSEWLDALLVNLALQGWRIAYFSPENQPVEVHIAKLLEKISGRPFGRESAQRLTREDVLAFNDDISNWFGWIEAPEAQALSASEVIGAAEPFLSKFEPGTKRGLVIDPWNELEHWRPPQLSETEYVSKTLSLVRSWARKHAVHVWMVAHPAKMRREDGGKLPIPKPDMISGSQHWWNKADCAITVWRNFEHLDSQEVQIHVQKVRFKHVGRPGVIELRYDRITGRYLEPPRGLREAAS
jgi:twinkle protein